DTARAAWTTPLPGLREVPDGADDTQRGVRLTGVTSGNDSCAAILLRLFEEGSAASTRRVCRRPGTGAAEAPARRSGGVRRGADTSHGSLRVSTRSSGPGRARRVDEAGQAQLCRRLPRTALGHHCP